MTATEAAFRQAVTRPDRATPEGLRDGAGRAAGQRFSVYRNNVAVALREALETGFPALARLIGAERFAHVARIFMQAHPPGHPRIALYGAEFADFIAGFEPLAHVGYLADVARLEYALRLSYHAGDAEPLSPAALAALDEPGLAAFQPRLAPAVRVVRSPWPVHAVRAYTLEGGPKPPAVAQDVLVARPGYDPVARVLPAGGADFVAALASGAPMGAAAGAAGDGFDLAATLRLLFDTAALCPPRARGATP